MRELYKKYFSAVKILFWGSAFSFLLILPGETFSFFLKVFSFYEYAFLKIFCSFALVIFHKDIQQKFLEIKEKFQNKETIEGIPKEELLDFLFERKKFPAKEVQEKFGINAKKYSRISQKLSENEIIEKTGPQNSYLLSEEFSRAEVSASLSGVSRISDMWQTMKILRG